MSDLSEDDDDNVPLIQLANRCKSAYEQLQPKQLENVQAGQTLSQLDFNSSLQSELTNFDVVIEDENNFTLNTHDLVMTVSDLSTVDIFSDIPTYSSTPSHDLNLSVASEVEVQTDNQDLQGQTDTSIDMSVSCETTAEYSNDFELLIQSAPSNIHSYSKQSKLIRSSRKRTKNEAEWKQNVRKRQRNEGKEYVNKKGDRIPLRVSCEANCKCKYKCKSKVSDRDRETVFNSYWTKSFESQRSFIHNHVHVVQKSKSKADSRRNRTYQYFLPIESDNETKNIQVCKSYFLKSLGIGEKTVHYTLNKGSDITDKRGKLVKARIPEQAKDSIREHIKRFPTVESHYCRKESQRQYLDRSLSVRQMYRLYVDECKKSHTSVQKFWLYERIFTHEFNLGFHQPKKDLCSFCESYKQLNKADQELKKDQFELHQKRKNDARQQKSLDKEQALLTSRTDHRVINFDLQKVLISPKTDIGEAYYSRKLATYNLSIFDIVSREGKCYMWYETIAKRGSCEIASCIYDYMKMIGPVKHLVFYSDSCTGQQRNLYFSSMCLYSVVNLPIETITHNYFERGHSQMEGDSVHATVERYVKKRDMFSPSDYFFAVRNCKMSQPKYDVKEITQADIVDFKKLSSDTISNRKIDTDSSHVKWNKIHAFQYRKDEPSKIFFKYNYGDDWRSFEVNKATRRATKLKSLIGYKLKALYTCPIPISNEKYNDLMTLCQKSVIPPVYHSFYKTLPHGNKSSRLPEPDASEDSE